MMTDPSQLPPEQIAAMSPEERRTLLQRLLRQQADAANSFPMSVGQQGLWYAYRRNPDSTAYNVFLPARVRTNLNLDVLRQTIHALVERHPCLRTTFSDQGAELRQTVHRSLPPAFEVLDAAGLQDQEIRQRVLDQTQRPFNLEAGPLLRLAVFVREAPHDFIIVATSHHIVVDYWSLVLVLSELREIYRSLAAGASPSLPPPSGNYASFVAEQQQLLTSSYAEEAWQYWQRELEGVPLVLNWFTDFERPAIFTGRANVVSIPFSSSLTSAIQRIATEQGCTQAAVVLAAVQVFIARNTRENDFLIGSPFAGRGHTRYEETVGFFVNLLPLRARLTDNPTFALLVRRASKSLVTAMEHERFPLAEIVRRIQPPRDPSRSPLFQVTCTFERSHLREEAGRAGFLMPNNNASADLGGLHQQSFAVPHPTCHHDLEFIFEQTPSSWQGMLCYCRDLFDEDTAQCMAENFSGLLQTLVRNPHAQVNDLPWDQPHRTSSLPLAPTSPTTLTQLIERAFQDHAQATALIANETTWTYQQLDRASRAVADELQSRGIGRGDLVPVVGTRGPATIAAMLGTLRSGAAVVPIDADQPTVAYEVLVQDTGAKCFIAETRFLSVLRELSPNAHVLAIDPFAAACLVGEPKVIPHRPTPQSDDLAYVIYTSGTTGTPKGVMIDHGAIANTMLWRSEHVPINESDRVLMLLSHQFDAGFGIALSTLIQGGALVWPASVSNFDLEQTLATMESQKITVLPAVPSLLQLIVTHPRFVQCDSLRQIWSGGEAMPAHLLQDLRDASHLQLWNFFGPTEASVEAAAFKINVKDYLDQRLPSTIPIGSPISNTEVVVLDPRGHIVPATVPGQLAIMGRGLARGYLNRDEQTASAFVTACSKSSISSRMYLTGDLGRQRKDGCLEWLGRIDQQVKLRGYRIELEEIEHVLRRHPEVSHAVVIIDPPDGPAASLIAYVVMTNVSKTLAEPSAARESIRRHLAVSLPIYKRPSQIHWVDALPLGPTGKVNRQALQNAARSRFSASSDDLPQTPLEAHLARLWSDVLACPTVGVHRNFFELGGSSLQAAMMTTRLSEDLGVHVPTALVFDLEDIASMAARLTALHPRMIGRRFGEKHRNHDAASLTTPATTSSGLPSPSTAHDTYPLIARLGPTGAGEPIFMVHPPGGIVICYRELALQLSEHHSLMAIRSRGLHGHEPLPQSIEAMAAEYATAIQSVQPVGPYVVGGWSLGGVIAYEVARQLMLRGTAIKKLILLDSTLPHGCGANDDPLETDSTGVEYGIYLTLRQLSELDADAQLPFLWQHAVNLGVLEETADREVVRHLLEDLKHLFHHHVQLASDYRIQPLDVPVLLVRPRDTPVATNTMLDRGWGRWVKTIQVQFVSGHHHSMVAPPHVSELAQVITEAIK